MPTLGVDVSPVSETVYDLWEAYPDAVALEREGQELSYGELDRRADVFAAYLVKLGTVPGSTVAICLERSFEFIVAALAAMRAGAAYVPLDLSWPDSRLRFAIQDSGADVLVGDSSLLDRLRVAAQGVDPLRDAAIIDAMPRMKRKLISPESLAYLIYTSGSTGRPKGVEITHSNLAHLIQWHNSAFSVARHDRVSHLLGLGFDAAVLEIWAHLCAGATLCLAADQVRTSPPLIQEWLIRDRITIAIAPAVIASRLMEMTWPAPSTLRLLISGGDALHRAPGIHLPFQVVNQYGPTECTVVSTWALLTPGAHGKPPIGLSVTGTRAYLLDDDGEIVPDGQIGEIYIGGRLVGRGYRNLPDLTRRSFLPDPFSQRSGARMYRTGDLAILRPDGELEFRGRVDRQIKIRGQRIELDEIGNTLIHHPGVEFATAMPVTADSGEVQLVAYVLLAKGAHEVTAIQLQAHLRHRLPGYMIPSTFFRLSDLPVSANGKLDFSMLPPPATAEPLENPVSEDVFSPIEEKMLRMVRELLENEAIVAQDNFFLVGGHSLLGMQLVMNLRRTFGVDFTLQRLFEASTIRCLSLLVETELIDAIESISDEQAQAELLG